MIQTGAGRYSGALYTCTGTYFGIPWVPANHGCVQAGDAQFVAESVVRGQLTYRVNGVQVVKTIERLALTPIDVGGIYLGGMLIKNSAQCNGGANTTPYAYQFIVTEKAASVVEIAQISLQGQTDCIMEGVTVQTGRVRTMVNGIYTCGEPSARRDLRHAPHVERRHRARVGRRPGQQLHRDRDLQRRAAAVARRRAISKSTTAAAAATLSDSTPPGIGIVTVSSPSPARSAESPAPSLPIASATRRASVARSIGVPPDATVATTRPPRSRARGDRARSTSSWNASWKCAPCPRAAPSATTRTRNPSTATPTTRRAAAERSIEPRLPGSCTLVEQQAVAGGRIRAAAVRDGEHADARQQRAQVVEQRLRHDERVRRRTRATSAAMPGRDERILGRDDQRLGRAVRSIGADQCSPSSTHLPAAPVARRGDQARDLGSPGSGAS